MQKENKRCIPKEGMPHASTCQKKERENKRCIPKEGMPHASACQKKKKPKDAYPKKVCHMLRHVKKKEKKIAPYPKRKKKRNGSYKGVHTPSTKNIHTLAHLDQGL